MLFNMFSQLRTLLAPFCVCFLAMIFFPLFFPSIRILSFAPLITLIISRLSRPIALWLATLSGVIIDLYSIATPFGFFALNYCIATLLIYQYRKYFLEEKIHIFALYSILFSFVSTFIGFILFAVIEVQLKLNIFTLFSDLILMPIFDGVYAYIVVLFPISAYKYLMHPKRILYFKRSYWRLTRKLRIRWNQLRSQV